MNTDEDIDFEKKCSYMNKDDINKELKNIKNYLVRNGLIE